MTNQRPHYKSLDAIALLFGALLVEEVRLPFSSTTDGWLIGLWVLLFYCALAVWLSANRRALQSEPWPMDRQQSADHFHAPEIDEIDKAWKGPIPGGQTRLFYESEDSHHGQTA